MALRFRIKQVPESRAQQGTDANGQPLPAVVGWKAGVIFVDVEVFDTANPATVLLALTYDFPFHMSNDDILIRIANDVRRYRLAFERWQALNPEAHGLVYAVPSAEIPPGGPAPTPV